MAVNAAEQASIIELAVLMFDVAPGATYLPFLTNTYEQNGRSLSALANVLDGVGPFLEMHPANESANTFADEFLGPLGLAQDSGARAFVLEVLNTGGSKGQVAYLAWNYLHNLAANAPQAYQDAKAIMENKAAVAAHYSAVLMGAAEDFETLHDVIAGVTADDASVAAAIDALDDAMAGGPELTAGHDFVNPGGTAAVNVTGSVDGDDDGGTATGTYSAGDSIIGNGNTNLKLTVRETGDVPDAALTNIESVYLKSATSPGDVTFDAADWTGVGMVRLADGHDGLDVAIDNLEPGTGVSIEAVTGTFDVAYQLADGLSLTLANTHTDETSSFILEAGGDAQAHLGSGAALHVDSTGGLGDVAVSASDDAIVDIALGGDIAEAGAIDIDAADGASVQLDASDADEAAIGAVSVTAGANAEVEITIEDIAGDAAIGATSVTTGASGVVAIDVDSIVGDLTAGAITVATGTAGDAAVALTRVAGGLTVGNLSLTGGAGASVAATLSGTDAAEGALAAGTITLSGSADADLLVEDFASAAVGNVSLTTGADTAAQATFRDIAGNLAVGTLALTGGESTALDAVVSNIGGNLATGNVSLTIAADDADAELRVSGVDGTATLGTVGLTGGDAARLVSSVTASGNVSVGATTASAGDDAAIAVSASAAAGASVQAGAVGVTAGESADVDISVELNGVLADHALGTVTAGGVTLAAAQDADVSIRMGQTLVSTNTEDAISLGDASLGDFSLEAGDNARIAIDLRQSAVLDDVAGFTDGDLVVGDIGVAVSATAEDSLSGGSHVDIAILKAANPGMGAGGNLTVGDVSVSGGDSASFNIDIAYEGDFAQMGDVSVGTIAIAAGEDALSLGARVAVSNAASGGDIGDLTLAGADITVGQDSDVSFDIVLTKAGGAGDIGNVSLGSLVLDAGEDAEIGVDFDVFGVNSDTALGNFAIGDVSVTAGEGAVVDLDGLGIPAADLQAIGTVGIGAVTASIAADAEFSFKPGIHVNAAMGAVTLGAVSLTAGEAATAGYDVQLSGATVGAVALGGWTLVGGEGSSSVLGVDIAGDLGAVTMGAISIDLAQDAEATATVQLGGADSIGGAVFGAIQVTVDDGAMADVALDLSAGEAAGDMTVGDVSLTVADLGVTTDDEAEVGGSIQLAIGHAGDADDTLTAGDIAFAVEGTADADEIHASIVSNGDVVLGDIVVSGQGIFILDGQSHLDPTLDLNVSFLSIVSGGEITIGNVDFSGYENDIVLDFSWIDHGAASITAGSGDDTVHGTASNNTLSGGDGIDTIDLTEGGVDTVHTANGDSGKTESTIDSIVAFAGGTNGAGDKLDFDLVAGASGNYVEGTGAANYATFITHANTALNSTVRYFAEVVGGDILVAVNYGSGEADMVIKLVGQTNLANLGFQNFVA